MIKSLATKAGLGFNGERIRAHCFRKFFDLQLQGQNVNRNVVYWMIGHVVDGVEESYFQGQAQRENLRTIAS
jgi:hypothetical protein